MNIYCDIDRSVPTQSVIPNCRNEKIPNWEMKNVLVTYLFTVVLLYMYSDFVRRKQLADFDFAFKNPSSHHQVCLNFVSKSLMWFMKNCTGNHTFFWKKL